jgi:very-short-patch-repair endonuclease
MSPPEARLWNALRAEPLSDFHFRRQVPLGPYYADFASHRGRLVIEVDGATHGTDASIARDERRTAFINGQGYVVLRFATTDILGRLDDVIATIGAHLDFDS